jgi:predicted metal-dependent hydrolase
LTQKDVMQKRRKSTLDAQIDQNLKRAYEDVLKEEVPDRLTQLLEQLKAQDAKKKSGGDA